MPSTTWPAWPASSPDWGPVADLDPAPRWLAVLPEGFGPGALASLEQLGTNIRATTSPLCPPGTAYIIDLDEPSTPWEPSWEPFWRYP